jgi:PAS domain-containing protein
LALAGVVAGAQEGITVVDAGRRFVYANPVACEMLGYPLAQLQGRDFMGSIPARDHAIMLARFSEQFGGSLGEAPAPFTCNLRDPSRDGLHCCPENVPARSSRPLPRACRKPRRCRVIKRVRLA